MAFFSFSLLKEPFTYLSTQIQPKLKYYSKDISLCKELNKKNKKIKFCRLNYEMRSSISSIGKKLLICLPPKFGLGDAIEYGIAIQSLIKSKKYSKIGIAFCSDHFFIFKNIFLFSNIYPLIISEDEIKNYDTIFHITLEIKALKFQKYKRSNIAFEICKYFNVPMLSFDFKNNKVLRTYKKTISIFPVSTSVIRSLPFTIIEEIANKFTNDYKIRVIIDNSNYSECLKKKNFKKNFLFIKPKNVKELFSEVSKSNFGIFVDSGPLHIAKIYSKLGILIETSVQSKVLLTNSKNIYPVHNVYKSRYCNGPCGLVDVFAYDSVVGCYETNKISFDEIKTLNSFRNLQRWNKKDSNAHFISNPVGCVKQIDLKNIIDLIKVKIKESQ